MSHMFLGSSQRRALLNVSKMLLGETNTYNDVYQRPYNTTLGEDEMGLITEATHNFTRLSPQNLTHCAGSFIRPKAQPGMAIGIDNGWGEQRLRFMMVVEYQNEMTTTSQIVTGYTDRADLSFNGELDPNTRFYINNVITTRQISGNWGNGNTQRTMVAENFQVLRDTTPQHSGVTLRPKDVFEANQASGVMESLGEMYGMQGTTFHDTRRGFNLSESIKLSRRKNAVSANYMSEILNSYKHATEDDNEYQTDDSVFDKAISDTEEPLVYQNPLLKMLAANTGFQENTAFSLHELRELCPHVDDVMVLSRSSGVSVLPNQRGQTSEWGGSDQSTMVANILATTIPALALDHLLTKVWFTATNDTMDGQIYCELNHTADNPPMSFTQNLDITAQIRSFMHRLQTYVMRDITHNNMISVSVSVRYDVLGDTFLSVSTNGEPPVDYVVPTFCDSLFSPIMAADTMNLSTMASDFQMLLDYNHDYHRPQYEPQQPQGRWGSTGGGWGTQQPTQPQGVYNPAGGTIFDN